MIPPYTPDPWDWTGVRERVARMDEHHIHHLDVAVADVRCHLHAEGIARVDREHANAMWVGARLAIGGLLAAFAEHASTEGDVDPVVPALVQAHIDIVEELCCAARDLWPTRPPRPTRPGRPARPPDPPAGPAGSAGSHSERSPER